MGSAQPDRILSVPKKGTEGGRATEGGGSAQGGAALSAKLGPAGVARPGSARAWRRSPGEKSVGGAVYAGVEAGALSFWGTGKIFFRDMQKSPGDSRPPRPSAMDGAGDDVDDMEALGGAVRVWREGGGGARGTAERGRRESSALSGSGAGAVALEGLGYDADTQRGTPVHRAYA